MTCVTGQGERMARMTPTRERDMRYHDNGCFYSVSVSAREVEDFKSRWPCSGLPDHAVTFQFDKTNGDLVDIWPSAIADQFDGDAAIALSQDAQAYGEAKQRQAVKDTLRGMEG